MEVQHVREQRHVVRAGIDLAGVARDHAHAIAEPRELTTRELGHLGPIDERRTRLRVRVEERRGVRPCSTAEIEQRARRAAEPRRQAGHQLAGRRCARGEQVTLVRVLVHGIDLERAIAADHLGEPAPALARHARPWRVRGHAQRVDDGEQRAHPAARVRGPRLEDAELVCGGDRGVAQEVASGVERGGEDVHLVEVDHLADDADLALGIDGHVLLALDLDLAARHRDLSVPLISTRALSISTDSVALSWSFTALHLEDRTFLGELDAHLDHPRLAADLDELIAPCSRDVSLRPSRR